MKALFAIFAVCCFFLSFEVFGQGLDSFPAPQFERREYDRMFPEIDPWTQPDPSCATDPCACGWCLDTPSQVPLLKFPTDKDLAEDIPFPWRGPIFQTDPTCLEDPCLCGYCIPPWRIERQFYVPDGPSPLFQIVPGKGRIPDANPGDADTGEIPPIVVDEVAHNFGTSMVDAGSFCPDQNRRPWRVTRESFFTRSTMRDCTDLVNAMHSFHDELRLRMEMATGSKINPSQLLVWPSDLGTGILKEEMEAEAKKVFFDYAAACLRTLDDVADVGANTELSSSNFLNLAAMPGAVAALKNSVGILQITGSGGDPCSASLVRLAGRPYLVAALHCLGKESC